MAKEISKDLGAASKAELQLLDQLWQNSPQTVREISLAVYGNAAPSKYATVQTLLDRLEKKGWVNRDRSAFRHTFSPAKSRDFLIGEQIQQVANSVCNGSIAALLGHFAKSKPSLSDKERDELRKLIESADS